MILRSYMNIYMYKGLYAFKNGRISDFCELIYSKKKKFKNLYLMSF